MTMLARPRIGPQLLFAPGAVFVLLLLSAWLFHTAMARQNAALESIAGQRAASLRAAHTLALQAQQAHAGVYRLLSWRSEPLRQDILARQRRIGAGLAALARVTSGDAAARQVAGAVAAQRRYVQAVKEVVARALRDGRTAAHAMQKAERALGEMAQRLEDLAALEEALAREASSRARADFRMISILMPALLLLAPALALAITCAVAGTLRMPAPEEDTLPAAAPERRRPQASHLRLVSSRT